MPFLKNINKLAITSSETGLSTNSNFTGGRFYNKSGEPNIEMKHNFSFKHINVYHTLLSLPTWKFLLYIFLLFLGFNFLFASIYLYIGIENLSGMVAKNDLEKFGEAFFFSAQTFTTVGYGRINPVGFGASFTAALEALVGLMSFALITGLLYGRFAKPRAFIRYSKNAIFAPFKDGVAVMFRMVPYTKNFLVNVEVLVTLALKLEEDGILKNKFFTLLLDTPKAATLTLNWTLVHRITEESPLYGLKKEDIEASGAELLVFVQGFDESFSSTVISRTSYLYNEFVYGAKFVPMYEPNEDNTGTIIHLEKLDEFEKKKLPIEY